jgi:hypothetical protein
MNKLAMLGILVILGGCQLVDRDMYVRELGIVQSNYYTRADVDALNATSQCKLLARNLVQVARCDVRR